MECTAVLTSDTESSSLQTYLFNKDASTGGDYLNATKIRQSNRLDQGDFQNTMNDRSDQHGRPITNAYAYLHERVKEWLEEDPLLAPDKARALYEVITQFLVVAAIELDEHEKPHFIFEILNSRGERLTEADFIKNTVMYEGDVVDDEQAANSLWGMFEDTWWRQWEARGRELQMQLDRFLNYWCMLRTGANVQMRRTATAFRKHIEEVKNSSDDSPITTIREVAYDIRRAGAIYRNVEMNLQPGIEDVLKRVKVLEVSVIMPPLLWLYTEDIADHRRQSAVRAMESFIVRRALCNLGTQGLNALFIELVNNMKRASSERPIDEFVTEYLANQEAENRIWPDDKPLMDYLTSRGMPGNAARRKMILETIEYHKRTPMMEPLGDTVGLTVEHILPRGWKPQGWPLRLDGDLDEEEATDLRDERVYLIGNLTLATKALNSSMSNASWADKRRALGQHSALALNKELLEHDDWHDDAIVERSAQLAKAITEIWPRPS